MLRFGLQAATSGGLSETEKKEKKALEKKLCEMEEELKVSTKLILLSTFYLQVTLKLFPNYMPW